MPCKSWPIRRKSSGLGTDSNPLACRVTVATFKKHEIHDDKHKSVHIYTSLTYLGMGESEPIVRYIGFIIALIIVFYFMFKTDKTHDEEGRSME